MKTRARFAQTTVAGEVIRTTAAAVLFKLDDGDEVWVPRRVCLDGDSAEEGDTDLVIADWWLEKEGRL